MIRHRAITVMLAAMLAFLQIPPTFGQGNGNGKGKGDGNTDPVVQLGEDLFKFETFGGNGRTCQTCHAFPTGTLNPLQISLLPANDPLFQLDAADTLGGNTFNRVLNNATILVGIPMAANVSLVGSTDQTVFLPRGIPTMNNTAALDPVLMWDGRAPDLQEQALDAWIRHSEVGVLPTEDELDAVAAFQQTLISEGQLRKLLNTGATPQLPVPKTPAQKRGFLFFTDDNPANGNPIKGRCVHCHSGPMLNETSPGTELIFGIPQGTRFISAFVSEFELGGGTPETYQFSLPGGGTTEVTSTDPGRALITGDPADANAFKIPTIWGFQNTAPYFHNNGAADLDELMDHYQNYFNFVQDVLGVPNFGMTDEEKADITAYMKLFGK